MVAKKVEESPDQEVAEDVDILDAIWDNLKSEEAADE